MKVNKPVLAVLGLLASAYPEKAIDKRTLQVYQSTLSDIPGELLRQAALTWVKESPWFPRVADLRRTAARLAGVSSLVGLPAAPSDPLYVDELALQDSFARGEAIDVPAWQAVAQAYRHQGREEMGLRTLARLSHYQSLLEEDDATQNQRPAEALGAGFVR